MKSVFGFPFQFHLTYIMNLSPGLYDCSIIGYTFIFVAVFYPTKIAGNPKTLLNTLIYKIDAHPVVIHYYGVTNLG